MNQPTDQWTMFKVYIDAPVDDKSNFLNQDKLDKICDAIEEKLIDLCEDFRVDYENLKVEFSVEEQ